MKKRIFLVDDEAGFTEMLTLNLEQEGYEVKVENNARFAQAGAKAFRPDLILLDVVMPEEEGPQVFRKIQQEESLKNVPVVFLTATVTREEVQEQKGAIGGHQFIAKPTDLDVLLGVIEENIMARVLHEGVE